MIVLQNAAESFGEVAEEMSEVDTEMTTAGQLVIFEDSHPRDLMDAQPLISSHILI